MARPLRIEYKGALYHLTGRGNRREAVFADEEDWERFLSLLAESLRRYQVVLHAYVLMGNHYHLLGQTQLANLGRWMHWLVTSYTVRFNHRHRRVGHLFQGRYKSIVMEGKEYLLSLSRYIHLNPVRGLRLGRGSISERRERLRAWRWSSYRGYAGLAKREAIVEEELILGELGGRGRKRRLEYRRFVESALLEPIVSPLEEAKWQAVLGSEGFHRRVRDRLLGWKEKRREIQAVRHCSKGPGLEEIVRAVARAYGLSARALREQRSRKQEAKGVAMTLVWEMCGLSLREIGEYFGRMDYAAVAQQIRRTRIRQEEGDLKYRLPRLRRICQRI